MFNKYAREYFKPGMKVLEIGPDSFPSTYQKIAGDASITWDTLDIRKDSRLTHTAINEYAFPIPDDTRVHDPFGLFNIELTNRCPMKCIMCARTHAMTRPQGDMEVSLFEDIIDQLCAANPRCMGRDVLWLHHFGESLLHPRFDHCIRYASARGIRTGLSMNPLCKDCPELVSGASVVSRDV